MNANVIIDKDDPRGSTYQILYSVTRANQPTERHSVLTMDWAQKYQISMAESVQADFWHLQPAGAMGVEINYDIFYGKDRPNVKVATDILKIPASIDVAIAHDRYTHIRVLRNIGGSIGFPLIYVEHYNAKPRYDLEGFKEWVGDIPVVFRNSYAQASWGYDDTNSQVILDGIDVCNRNRKPTSGKWLTIHDHIDLSAHPIWIEAREMNLPLELRGFNGCWAYETTEAEEHTLFERHKGWINLQVEDSMPFDMLRAMGYGMPVISVRNEALEEFFKDGKSILFIESPDELKDKMTSGIKSLDNIGEGGREVIKKRFTKKAFTEAWEKLIQETRYD